MRSALAVALVIVALTAAPAAAEVDVHASLNRESAAVGETVELTVAITGAVSGVTRPEIPSVEGIEVVGSSSQQNITFANGQVSSINSYVFRLRPTREGTFTIPGIEVQIGGEVYTTTPLTLTVSGGSRRPTPAPSAPTSPMPPDVQPAAPETGDDIFATTEVDDRTPYVGQQVTLTLTFYQSHRVRLLSNPEYTPPETEGLVAEPLPSGEQISRSIDGVPYEIITRRTALIAPAAGEYTIGPATITYMRSYLGGEETITTDPITLEVRDLPGAGRPEGFSGLVGRFHAELSADTDRVRVGGAAAVRLTVTGTGNLRQLEAPELPLRGRARLYQSSEQRRIGPQPSGDGHAIGGSVALEYLVMPEEPGTVTLGPVTLHYFNPQTERYEAAVTSEVALTVLPASGSAGASRPEAGEIRYIKTHELGLRSRPPVTASAWFWLLQLAPVAGLGWALGRRSETLRRARDPQYRRFVEAESRARRVLRALDGAASTEELYDAADEILTEYIAAKTGVAAASLGPEEARELLASAGVDKAAASEAGELLEQLRAGLYAPGSSRAPSSGELRERLSELIEAIEAALR
ncbi:MAG: BatD family protein [Armatimonadota bacterium]|nr:BatD family protein [Armatimonadota bacterium]